MVRTIAKSGFLQIRDTQKCTIECRHFFRPHSLHYLSVHNLGRQRLWSSIGFGSAVFITGLLLDFTGDMNVIFYIFGATAAGFIFVASQTDFDVSARIHGGEVETLAEDDEDERVYVDEEEERL